MQLGTRWNVGGEPPARLPEAMVVAVRGVEDELASESVDTTGWGWTLTFLEGKPIVALDDGTSIHLDDAGHAQVTNPDDAAEED
ncbi:hypothetical protein DEJ28_05600 [Curtobacterium sp. MCPF17_002]|jgi:hypothetical protein|uniref:hypothetical protein n=1 Tax=Curtobacterium sp. MCPF17_002 TaxID=2175645 RepID=UPI000DA83EBE|nr:hypothetical protein [Curtobacterium sp. MCPF17_002]WIB78574.1 hypothetical protein DEJ28_05600 [Curtobacterium sp. MCPF17_002]